MPRALTLVRRNGPLLLRRSQAQRTAPPPTANGVLVGGVNSPVRAFRRTGDRPLLLLGGRGASVAGADGRRYLDFIMGWGALLHGHQPAPVSAALRGALRQGTLTGLTHPDEARLAGLIAAAVPSVEQVRFTASGTEACMTAVRLARAHTGRRMLLMFAGGYHGHSDPVLAGASAGLSAALADETIHVPYNDAAALERAIQEHGAALACAIVEPVAANMGVVPPEPGFLKTLRQLTAAVGILLIFDEIVTGFRLAAGGAQARFGIRPDLTVFGKIIGGGMPIGAVGGPRRLMRRLAPEGDVYHAGTFAGHPLSMAAGIAALTAAQARPPYAALERLGSNAAAGLREAAAAARVPVQVNQVGSMLTMFFADRPVRNLADARRSRTDRFAQWARGLRAAGILVPPSPFEALFVSAAHTPAHVARLVRTSRRLLTRLP